MLGNARGDDGGSGGGGGVGLFRLMWVVVLGSFGTAAGWFVLFFVAEGELGFGPRENLLLGLVSGVSYTASAATSGRLSGWLARRSGLGLRGVLAFVLLWGGGVSMIAAFGGEVGVWVYAVLYFWSTGVLWPVVQAYLSGGRSGGVLRRASGVFNICWSSSVVVFVYVVSPVVAEGAVWVFGGLAAMHVLAALGVLRFPREPGAAGGGGVVEGDDGNGAFERRMLAVFRVLNFSSYLLLAALTPVLPHVTGGFGVGERALAAVGGTVLAARLVSFAVMTWWGGWHAMWGTGVVAGSLLVVGFGLSFFAWSLGGLVVGLGVMGLGAGAAYAGAIYFALHARGGEVGAGGWHETIIGSGYVAGPVLGLVLVGLVG